MLRSGLARNQRGTHKGVPWRSHEVTRIEALSDAVFAFAVTLLVVALEVPATFTELSEKMHGFPAFALSFAMLFQVWYSQHIFFRRYGLQDTWTLVLNGVLLFLVLFYMYPLKFLAALIVSQITGGNGMAHLADGRIVPMLENRTQAANMMIIYGLGFAAVFGVFALLYWHARRQRTSLELSDVELFDNRDSIESNLMMVGIALLSIIVLFVTKSSSLSGLTYMLIGVARTLQGVVRGRQRRQKFRAV